MTRFLAFLAALLLAGAASAAQLFVNAPNDGFLNLRSGPSTGYEVLHQMRHGSQVEVLSSPGRWYRIRHESGHVGWASSSYLSQRAELKDRPRQDQIQAQRLYVNAPGYSGLNLRDGPGTGHAVLTTMQQGSWVELLGRQGEWRLLRHESGRVGWAHSGYLSDTQPREAPRYQPPQQETPRWRRDEDPRAGRRDYDDDDRRGWGHRNSNGRGHEIGKGMGHDRHEADRREDDRRERAERERERERAERARERAEREREWERERRERRNREVDARNLPLMMLNCAAREGQDMSSCIARSIVQYPGLFRD